MSSMWPFQDKKATVPCVWCDQGDADWFGRHPETGQGCYFCRHCRNYFIFPHTPWIPSVTDDEDPDTFQFWGDAEAEKAYALWRSKENERVARMIRKQGDLGRVLEIGFGEGPLTELLVNDSLEYWGIEPVPASLKRTVDRFGLDRERVFCCTAEEMLGTTSLKNHLGDFDTIILVSVLEHLSYPKKILDDCYKLLAPTGRLIVSTPDSSFFLHLVRLRRLLRMEPWTRFHISFFSPQSLKQGAESIGYSVLSESSHRLVTKESSDYFGKLTKSRLIRMAMNCSRKIGVDLFFRITTVFFIFQKPGSLC